MAIISGLNLASKIVPDAWEKLTTPSAEASSQLPAPASKAHFTTALQKAELRPELQMDRSGWSNQLLADLHSLPEVQALMNQDGYDQLNWRISQNGKVQAIWADRMLEEIDLSPESQAKAQQIFKLAQSHTPPLFPTQTNTSLLELGTNDSARSAQLSWRANGLSVSGTNTP